METEKEQVVEEKVVETPPAEELEETPSEEKLDEETPPEEKPPEEEPKPERPPEDMVPASVVGGIRRNLRASELEAARLRGQLEAQQTKPPEKSPIELAAEEQGVSVDDVDINGKLYKAQQAWEKDQTQNQVRQQATQDYQSGSEAAMITMTDENLGEGLGVEALGKVGEHLLTDTDHQEIFMAGKKCGTVLYKKLKERILEAAEPGTEELCKRLKPQKKSQPKPPIKPKKEKDEPTPSQEELLLGSDPQIEAQFDL